MSLLLEKAHYPKNDVDSCGNTALMEAVRSGHLDCVHLFLKKTPDVLKHSDSMGRMTIHLAAEAGKEKIVHSLIQEYEVDVDTLSEKGMLVVKVGWS